MDKLKILVIGANGQLGLAMQRYNNDPLLDFYFAPREHLDLGSLRNIDGFFLERHYDFIVNCAAYTAVDQAEIEEKEAYQVNAVAVEKIAQISKTKNSVLLHISTDYVFDGKNYRPYMENDTVNPLGVYGKSKLAGEHAIQAISPQGIIVRTSWLYGVNGKNFLNTMLKLGGEREVLKVVFDQIGTPTLVDDLARAICQIIKSKSIYGKQGEIYHFSNEGVASWYDFASSIFQMKDITCKVEPIQSSEYPTPARRPFYSVLNKSKIKRDFHLSIPNWRESLRKALLE